MIYTLTFNPAIDYIINVPDYIQGEVNRTSDEKILPGGKGLNVSVVLNNLKVDTVALGFVAGFSGKVIEDMLMSLGVRSDFIHLDEGFSRINVKIKSKKETEINAQGPKISKKAIEELYKKLSALQDGDTLVLAGSISSCLPDTIYCDILEALASKRINIIVDATKDLLTNTLKYKPFLIKPNIFELEEIFKTKLISDNDIIGCAKELNQEGAQNVLVSLGGDGAILLCDSGHIYKLNAPSGKVVNTTGAGDSLVAGFLAGLCKKDDMQYALKMGISAGSASAFSDKLATEEEIINIFNFLPDCYLIV